MRVKVKVSMFLAYEQDMERPVGRGKHVFWQERGMERPEGRGKHVLGLSRAWKGTVSVFLAR